MTPTAVDQILAGQQPTTAASQQPATQDATQPTPPAALPGKSPINKDQDELAQRLAIDAGMMRDPNIPTHDKPRLPFHLMTEEEKAAFDPNYLTERNWSAAANPPGRFWQAVTWDLHLTASGLIIFVCLAIAKFWPAQRDNFSYVVGLAATYLIGNTTGKTLPTKEDAP